MLIQLTELIPGITNPEVLINKQITINSRYVQTIRLMLSHYPYQESYSEITMASGEKINVGESNEEICKILNTKDNETMQ